MTMHELHKIWYDGNRTDPTFITMCKSMLCCVRVETTEESILYEVMRDDVRYSIEDWLRSNK